jgi:membrane associated rhomboid family serine protease
MTLLIIIVTCIVSILAFNKPKIFSKMQLNPYLISHRKEWYRLFTHALLHADWIHLIINMFVLYSFGTALEQCFEGLEARGTIKFYKLFYLFFYVMSILVSTLTTVKKHKDDVWYNAVGASGAVSAVVFATIFFNPWGKLYFYGFFPIPGIVFGILYLVYSNYMSRRDGDNINHDAHFLGAVFGFIFPIILDFKLFNYFISQLIHF